MADVTHMKVTGEKEVGSHVGQLRHGHRRAAGERAGAETCREIEGMMRHHNLDEAGGARPSGVALPASAAATLFHRTVTAAGDHDLGCRCEGIANDCGVALGSEQDNSDLAPSARKSEASRSLPA